jgi:hypothetical protein
MPNIQFRISLVNVPAEVSSLKLRGYLRAEAEDIHGKATEHSIYIVRVFLPERTLFAYTQKKLDALLEDIVNKYESIYRVEMVPVKDSLNMTQLQEAQQKAQQDLAELIKDVNTMSESLKDKGRTIH